MIPVTRDIDRRRRLHWDRRRGYSYSRGYNSYSNDRTPHRRTIPYANYSAARRGRTNVQWMNGFARFHNRLNTDGLSHISDRINFYNS